MVTFATQKTRMTMPETTIMPQEEKSCLPKTKYTTKDPPSICWETLNKYDSSCLTRDGCGNGVRLLMSLNHREV